MGDILLKESVPLMAKFTAGKLIGLLDRRGVVLDIAKPECDTSLTSIACAILRDAALHSASHRRLSTGLQSLIGRLNWYRGRGGPFGSVKFEDNHIHALLAGPRALEHREDLRIGLTVLGPYTRFPDHNQFHSRVFLPLSDGEFRFGEGEWVRADIGDVMFNAAGYQCAIRCTRNPMLLLWCQLEAPERQ
ncbi:hypothetical protein FKV68_08635 [Sinorhizobium mexicanum]|uniref:Dimethlysulfonioproprionate lyase DddL n=2 Tax=Sinorhizobium mexicanum TaxID=375549 RepID=A0A859QW29_9HYPH|nr:hypothetical protein FKV68_08635 [Sinorhizobium mexicanum]